MSYFHQFICPNCETRFPTDTETFLCSDCNTFLLAEYDLYRARREDYAREWDKGEGIWKYRQLLPIQGTINPVSEYWEGQTPIFPLQRLQKELGLHRLLVKDEGRNPGGTVMDREMAVVFAAIHPEKYQNFLIESTGSSGIAASRYARLTEALCTIVAPRGLSMHFLSEYETFSAHTKFLDWDEETHLQFWQEVKETAPTLHLNREAIGLRIEGAKTLFFEIVDKFFPELPAVIILPGGEGTLVIGAWKAFLELQRMGRLQKFQIPRIIVAEVNTCPTFDAVIRNYPLENPSQMDTIAPDLFFPYSVLKSLMKNVLVEQNWETVVISNEEILETWKYVANLDGIILSPEGAACLAALQRVVNTDQISPQELVLVVNPSNGIRHVQTIGFLKETLSKD